MEVEVPIEFYTAVEGMVFKCAAIRNKTEVRDYYVIASPTKLPLHTYRFNLVMVSSPPKYKVSTITHELHSLIGEGTRTFPTLNIQQKANASANIAFALALDFIAQDVRTNWMPNEAHSSGVPGH